MTGLQYVARKPMKVEGRTIQPGEIVPEAATWKNVKAYVNDGSLAIAVEVAEGAGENAELKVEVATLAERVAALEALVAGTGEVEGEIEVTPLTDSQEGKVTGFLDADELDKMKRPDLNQLAAEMGVEDPESFRLKDDLIAHLVTIPVSASADGEDPA
jgi:hypothetical protein